MLELLIDCLFLLWSMRVSAQQGAGAGARCSHFVVVDKFYRTMPSSVFQEALNFREVHNRQISHSSASKQKSRTFSLFQMTFIIMITQLTAQEFDSMASEEKHHSIHDVIFIREKFR